MKAIAIVTGASSGFGRDFARHLAKRGYATVLVARREEALRTLASELEATYSTQSWVMPADLADNDAREQLARAVAALPLPVEVLVNNAGLGLYGSFDHIPWEKERAMLQVDIEALTHLCKLFLPQMRERRNGYVLNVSSIGAFQPTPLYASYSAAKSYVLMFSQAINYELRGSGVSVTAVAPGIAATEFLQVSKQKPTRYQRSMMMTSEAVVTAALRALFKRKPSVVPGAANALTAFSTRFMPANLQASVAHALMKSNDPQH
jgi:short-subunit dehydrogenase